MLFPRRKKKINQRKVKEALQAHTDDDQRKRERALPCLCRQGSLTLETALVLPVFLFAFLCILYTVEIFRVQTDIAAVISDISRDLAKKAYVIEQAAGISGSDPLMEAAAGGFGSAYVKNKLTGQLGQDYLEASVIKNGGAGISCAGSSFMGKDHTVDIVVSYRVSLPFNLFGVGEIPVVQRARCRGWTGYDPDDLQAEPETMVYIAETGSVYHTDPGCTHIRLSVKPAAMESIAEMRNEQQGRYKACERCIKGGNYTVVYITETGSRYHSSQDCSGLKRSVWKVPLSEASDRSLCQRCAG